MTRASGRGPGPLAVLRRLSVDGEPLVSVGDAVAPDDPLLSMSTFPGQILRSPASRELRVPPGEVQACLVREPGEMVQEGEIIARSSLFWNHRLARSRHEGQLAGVSGSLGVVYLREVVPTQMAETVKIDVLRELMGGKGDFERFVRVKNGDKVEKGQVIASRMMGTRSCRVVSPFFGTIANIAPMLGTLSVIPDKVSSVVAAHIPGIVAAIPSRREVVVAGYGAGLDALIGLGGETHGRLVIGSNRESPWRPLAGETELEGAVLVTGNVDAASLAAAAGLGAHGVIAGSAHERDLCSFAGRELGVVATGEEAVSPVLILTEGFGAAKMSAGSLAIFQAHAGCIASLSGTTHIRAGVIRPRVLISVDPPPRFAAYVEAAAEELSTLALAERPKNLPEIAPGSRVRVLRGGHRGKSGTVLDLPETLHTLPSGSRVPVARVKLEVEAGQDADCQVLIPQTNLRPEVNG